jgi:hypothetical protein
MSWSSESNGKEIEHRGRCGCCGLTTHWSGTLTAFAPLSVRRSVARWQQRQSRYPYACLRPAFDTRCLACAARKRASTLWRAVGAKRLIILEIT